MQVSQILEEKVQAGPHSKTGKTGAGFGNALQEMIRQLGIGSVTRGTGGEDSARLPGESGGSADSPTIRIPAAVCRSLCLSEGNDDSSAEKSGDSSDAAARSGLAGMLAALAAEPSLPVQVENRPVTGTDTDSVQTPSVWQTSDSVPGPETVFPRTGTGKIPVWPFGSPMSAGVSQPPQAADAVSQTAVGTDGENSQTMPGLPGASRVSADTAGIPGFRQAAAVWDVSPAASSISAGLSVPSSPLSADGLGAATATGSSVDSALPQAVSSSLIPPFSQSSPLPQVPQTVQIPQASQVSQLLQVSQTQPVPQIPQTAVLSGTGSRRAADRTEITRPASRVGGVPDSSEQPSPARTDTTLSDGNPVRRVQPRENAQQTGGRADGQSPVTGGTVISMFRDHLQAEDRTAPTDGSFHTENIARQLAGALNSSADGGRSELRLHLSPADLGGINIRLVSQGGQVTLRITADNPHTGQLLASGLDDLNHAMSQNGIHMDKTEIFYSSADSSGGHPSGTGGQADPGGQPGTGNHSSGGGGGSSRGGRQAPEVYGAVSIRQTEEPVRTASQGTISIFA